MESVENIIEEVKGLADARNLDVVINILDVLVNSYSKIICERQRAKLFYLATNRTLFDGALAKALGETLNYDELAKVVNGGNSEEKPTEEGS